MKAKKTARERLAGHWCEAIAVQIMGLLMALLLLLGGWHTERAVRLTAGAFAQPFSILGVLLFCLLDLLLRSPFRAGKAEFYYRLATGQPTSAKQVLAAFGRTHYRKAVALRAALWTRRVLFSGLLLCPSAVLLALGDQMRQSGLTTSAEQMTYFLLALTALCTLVMGSATVELLLLMYMPAWYLLSDSPTAKEAMLRSRRMMKGNLGRAVDLYAGFTGWGIFLIFVLPYFYAAPVFATARAAWVRRRQVSVGGCIFCSPPQKLLGARTKGARRHI